MTEGESLLFSSKRELSNEQPSNCRPPIWVGGGEREYNIIKKEKESILPQ